MGKFYEFFSGGGMARAGLGPRWNCLFANDFDPKKGVSYAKNWGADSLKIDDVANLTTDDLPLKADLAWASFPCQDLSLAGAGAGLRGERSGTFWPFWKLIKAMASENRAPRLIVLENVCGALTAHNGKDFVAIGAALSKAHYRFGAVVIDAVHFLPQSRPRLFIIGVRDDVSLPGRLLAREAEGPWHTGAVIEAYKKLSKASKDSWCWWKFPAPALRNATLADIIEDNPKGVSWHTKAETKKLLGMMSTVNLAKVEAAKKSGQRIFGGVYKRTRVNEHGDKVQRAEVRFDDLAGCLRTPAGGSSRQTIIIVEGNNVRSRLLSPREAARLMGLPEEYNLPDKYNEAYHLIGDGVAVPVVRFIAENVLEPIVTAGRRVKKAAA